MAHGEMSMSARDELAALDHRDDLDVDAKRTERYRIKGHAIRDALAGVGVDVPLNAGDLTISFTRAPQYDDAHSCVTIWCEIRRDSRPIPLDLPICIVNAPLMAPTGPGGEMREDPRGAALEILRGLADG